MESVHSDYAYITVKVKSYNNNNTRLTSLCQDITGSDCLKGVAGKVIADERGIKDSWKEYMEKLMNEENEYPGKPIPKKIKSLWIYWSKR